MLITNRPSSAYTRARLVSAILYMPRYNLLAMLQRLAPGERFNPLQIDAIRQDAAALVEYLDPIPSSPFEALHLYIESLESNQAP